MPKTAERDYDFEDVSDEQKTSSVLQRSMRKKLFAFYLHTMFLLNAVGNYCNSVAGMRYTYAGGALKSLPSSLGGPGNPSIA